MARGADDQEQFHRHVLLMADAFTTGGRNSYPGRQLTGELDARPKPSKSDPFPPEVRASLDAEYDG